MTQRTKMSVLMELSNAATANDDIEIVNKLMRQGHRFQFRIGERGIDLDQSSQPQIAWLLGKLQRRALNRVLCKEGDFMDGSGGSQLCGLAVIWTTESDQSEIVEVIG